MTFTLSTCSDDKQAAVLCVSLSSSTSAVVLNGSTGTTISNCLATGGKAGAVYLHVTQQGSEQVTVINASVASNDPTNIYIDCVDGSQY